TLSVLAGRNLTADSTYLNAAPRGLNGKGANYTLTAGNSSVASAAFKVTGSINASGAGTGSGGSVAINYKDASNAFVVGSTLTNSGISGSITADAPAGGSGGTI